MLQDIVGSFSTKSFFNQALESNGFKEESFYNILNMTLFVW